MMLEDMKLLDECLELAQQLGWETVLDVHGSFVRLTCKKCHMVVTYYTLSELYDATCATLQLHLKTSCGAMIV